MRIIRQFKQGRTAKSIYKSLSGGDVFVLARYGVKYIVGADNFIMSEHGTVYYPEDVDFFFAGDKIKAIYKKEKGAADFLEDLLRAAESDIRKGCL